MYTISITLAVKEAADHLKEQIETQNPLLKGMVKIHQEPEMTTLDKLIGK